MSGGQGNRSPREWVAPLIELLGHEPAVVRVVVVEARGSTPRETGAVMLVGEHLTVGTIGGGRLEWEAIAAARGMLHGKNAAAQLRKSVLGPDLGQCCGGVVSTWLERFTPTDLGLLGAAAEAAAQGPAFLESTLSEGDVQRRLVRAADDPERSHAPAAVRTEDSGGLVLCERLDAQFPLLWLYGAGHVGRAVARCVRDLPLRLMWIDSRAQLQAMPGIRHESDPVGTVSQAPPGGYFLVMTHSHQLDFQLCHEVLQRDDFAWLGLIGSQSKSARFRSRLRRLGVDAERVARLVCPIGIEGIRGKWPATIALAAAAQIMREVCEASAAPARVAAALEACGPETCFTCAQGAAKVAS